jgi:hypothetical protein
MIQLYSYPTPNGIKVPILPPEERAVPYELNRVDPMNGEQRAPEFSLGPDQRRMNGRFVTDEHRVSNIFKGWIMNSPAA